MSGVLGLDRHQMVQPARAADPNEPPPFSGAVCVS
jgi:hypothetical protein